MVKLFTNLVNKTLRIRPSHVIQPGRFDSKLMNIHEWLEIVDTYLEEDNITCKDDRCRAILSRLSSVDKKLVTNTSSKSKKDYEILRREIKK